LVETTPSSSPPPPARRGDSLENLSPAAAPEQSLFVAVVGRAPSERFFLARLRLGRRLPPTVETEQGDQLISVSLQLLPGLPLEASRLVQREPFGCCHLSDELLAFSPRGFLGQPLAGLPHLGELGRQLFDLRNDRVLALGGGLTAGLRALALGALGALGELGAEGFQFFEQPLVFGVVGLGALFVFAHLRLVPLCFGPPLDVLAVASSGGAAVRGFSGVLAVVVGVLGVGARFGFLGGLYVVALGFGLVGLCCVVGHVLPFRDAVCLCGTKISC